MTIHKMKKIEDILYKYIWDFQCLETNIQIYNDLVKEIPELKNMNLSLDRIIDCNKWASIIIEADNLSKLKNK